MPSTVPCVTVSSDLKKLPENTSGSAELSGEGFPAPRATIAANATAIGKPKTAARRAKFSCFIGNSPFRRRKDEETGLPRVVQALANHFIVTGSRQGGRLQVLRAEARS